MNIVSTHTPELFASAVSRAAELLRAGEVVALPTETVYGLAANALNPLAVSKIFEIKGRPAHNPVIVHVDGIAMARDLVTCWPPAAELLARAFWPGPLTMVLPRAAHVPEIVTAGGTTVGIRWPVHPFIQSVIRACGFPLAAPSANLSNALSPTNAEHVRKQLGDALPLIVDGGQSQVGIESTVIDLTSSPLCILRPGMIHEESLRAVTGDVFGAGTQPRDAGAALRSPGMLAKHYAPRARLIVLNWKDDADLRRRMNDNALNAARCHVIAHTRVPSGAGLAEVSVIPHDAEAFARAIYAELHRCDEAGAECIVVETPPQTPEWHAIADRLKRASA